LQEFETSLEEGGERHNPQSKSWMDKVKDFFN
jgi:molecular chaperone DnaJ